MPSKKNTTKKTANNVIRYPINLVKPVASTLKQQIKVLKRRKKDISSEDPFRNVSRIADNAAPDADAEEQFGHARTTAIKEQIDKKLIQTRRALARIKVGKYGICENCNRMINTDRLMIKPEATLCIKCESKQEKK